MQIARERLKLNPKDVDALFALAAAQATLDDARGATQTLERLAEIEPNYPGLWLLKTKLHAQLGETEKARQSRLRAQQSEPASGKGASRPFPCPICEALVPADATTCANCGVKFEPNESMEDELDDLSRVAIQEMVQEEMGGATKAGGSTPKEPGKTAPKSVAGKGLTNGLAVGSRAGSKTGKTKGLKGRTNGLRGRTNGLTNGLRGRTNGLTNGVGRTNGLTNGIGRTNGLTNGLGRANGLTNGLGHTNGITNGLGRTNGLTNGLGSGFQSVAFRASRRGSGARAAGWKLYLIPLVSVSLLLLPLFFIPQYFGPRYPIQIDGQFGDWASVSKTNATVPLSIQNQDINITRVAVKDNLDFLSFYVEVRGTALSGGPAPGRVTNTFYAFIDVDRSRSTGYQVQGIGADRMIQVRTWGNSVVGASLFSFNASRSSTDWNGWMAMGPVYAAGSGSRLEFEAAWSDISQTRTGVEVAFASRSWDGQSDAGDVVVTNEDPFVMVSQDTRAPTVIAGSGLNLSRMTIQAVDGPMSLSALNVTFQGNFQPTSVAAVDLVDELGNVLSERPAARTVRFDFGPLSLARSETRVLATRVKVGSADGTTIGAFVRSTQDVIVAGGGVSLVGPISTPVSLSYIGAIPAGPRVDGAFGEWKNLTPDPIGDVQPVWDRDVDLRAYGFQGYGNNTYFAAAVVGTSLNGTMVPELNPTFTPASGNRTSNGTVSPPPPPLDGTDQVRFFLDADGSGGTGFRIGGIGADFLVEIRGQNGLITSASAMRFAGASQSDWSWTSIGVAPAAKARSEIEAALQGVRISNASRAFVQVSGWNGARDDSAPAPPIAVLSVNNPWGSPSPASAPLLGFNSVSAQDIPGNQQWFFTNGATSGTSCSTNVAASTTAGSAATSTNLSSTSAPICWFTPTSPPNTVAGPWEVILDIDKATNGTKLLRPNAQGDSNGWSAAGCAQTSAYLCVSDYPNDGDTTYIVSNASTPNDSLFNIFDWTGSSGTPPTPLSILNVVVEASCRKTASPSVNVAVLVKSGSTTAVGPTSQNCANSPTYTVWSDTFSTNPATGLAWTLADINALQVGVRSNNAQSREVRVSHVAATVTFVPVYTVQIDHCTNVACTTLTTLYGPSNFNTYGADITVTTPSIAAQTFGANDRIRFLVQLNGTGTSQNQGSVTVRYNGPYLGTDDSRGTVAIPEFGDFALPTISTMLLVTLVRRRHFGRARKAREKGALPDRDVPRQ